MKYLKKFLLFERTYVDKNAIDPSDIFEYLRDGKKDKEKFNKIKENKLKEIYLTDLLDDNDGLALIKDHREEFVKLLKEMSIKINLKKSKIEHPDTFAKVIKTLIEPKILSLEDLINAKVFDPMNLKSDKWSQENINKIISKIGTEQLSGYVTEIKAALKVKLD